MPTMRIADTPTDDQTLPSAQDDHGPDALPLIVAIPAILVLAAGSWAVVWEAGKALASLFG